MLAPLLNKSSQSDEGAGNRRIDVSRLQAHGHRSDEAHRLAEARGADADTLQTLLQQHPELLAASFGNKKDSLLTEAAREGKTAIVQVILAQALRSSELQAATIINHQDVDGKTALAKAIEHGHLEVAMALLRHDQVDVNRADKLHRTPLHFAATQKNPRFAAELLRRASILPSLPDGKGDTPLHLAIRSGRSEVAVMIAVHAKALPDQANREGQTPLQAAIEWNRPAVVEALLHSDDVNHNRPDLHNSPPLWQALTRWDRSQTLPDPEDAHGAWGQTLCKLVASPEIEVNCPGPNGETPLTYLCKMRHPRAECAMGPEDMLGVMDFSKWQVLTVKAVLASRADLDLSAQNSKGKTPVQVARRAGHRSLEKALEKESRARHRT